MRSSIQQDGRERTFTVVGGEGGDSARPLLLVFHGSRQTGEIHRAFTGGQFDALADGGTVIAYLDGYRGNWNDARRLSSFPARRAQVDDVAFAGAVIDRLRATHGVDPARVYGAGFSNGGQMVMRLLHEPSRMLAGGAVVAATLPRPGDFLLPQEQPAPHPVPVLLVHGTSDPISRYDGGSFAWWARRVFRVGGESFSFTETGRYFARRNGIDVAPRTSERSLGDGIRVTTTRWDDDGGASVEAVTVHGGGHTVPGPRRAPRILGRTATGLSVARLAGELFGLSG